METVFESEWGIVRYNSADGYIYHTFHKPISGASFREMLNAGLDALAEKGATKWLSDDRLNAEFAPEDVEFALADWGPRAAEAGWQYWALVVPEDVAGRASMTDIIRAFHELGVRVAVFTTVQDAHAWLIKR